MRSRRSRARTSNARKITPNRNAKSSSIPADDMANRGAGKSVTGEIQPSWACCAPLPMKKNSEPPTASRLKTQVRT